MVHLDFHLLPDAFTRFIHYGHGQRNNEVYMEPWAEMDIAAVLRKQGFKFDIMATSFFLSRRSIRPAAHSGMPLWQDRIFITLAKNANDATDFFQIPTGRVVEVGTQVTV